MANEGMLTASGDPAAAACSFISVFQNPDINAEALTGDNTWVARSNGSLVRLRDVVIPPHL